MKAKYIRKYLSGDCSFEEEQLALEILSTDEGLKILNELSDEFWDSELSTDKIDDKKLYKKITTKIERKERDTWSIIRYAAAFVILAVATFAIVYINEKEEIVPLSVQTEYISKSTTRGQKSTIMLSDGSKVVLNADSKISFPKYFTDSTRNIELIGEAFFQVAKDSARPFTVSAGNTKTTALGTSFNINSRWSIQKIALSTGKVEVSTSITENAIVLEPGDALEVNEQDRTTHQFQFDSRKELLWKDGVLFFENTTLKEIVITLELWYDVNIELPNNQLENKVYTGRFDNPTLKQVLESVSFALDFKYSKNGKKVKIITK